MNVQLKFIFLVAANIILFINSFGQHGANYMPYTRYEAEEAELAGQATINAAPAFRQHKIASEASGQSYVGLPDSASSITWTLDDTADGITLRFTLPDAPDGNGLEATLKILINGIAFKDIELTSYWAYQYFSGSDPTNTPYTNPRMRFDETHCRLNTIFYPGDTLTIKKSEQAGAVIGIDFIELEKIADKINKPASAYTVIDYGAVPDDGNDDLAAFNQCIAEADEYGADVYIPEGKFILSDQLTLDVKNMKIQGAGMWYTEIYFSQNAIRGGGILGHDSAGNLEICNFYLSSALNSRFINGEYASYHGFSHTFGVNSQIHHVWVEHFETGFWIADYVSPVAQTISLKISNCRIRNTYADGINFSQGTSFSIVEHSNIRNTGDDALACWPNDHADAKMAKNNIFRYNTIEHTWRAAGIGVFGGDGHQVHHNFIKDGFAGSGIRLTTDFPGYHFQNTKEIKFFENTIIHCGTSNDLWDGERGAIELAATGDPIENITFENIDILNSQRNAIQLGGNSGFSNINFKNINIDGTGLDPYTKSKFTESHEGKAVMIYTSIGTASFKNIAMSNIEAADPILIEEGFNYELSEVDQEFINPKGFYLGKNYPNPFNSGTRIDYTLPQKTKVEITVYDILGRKVDKILNTTQEQGRYSVVFDGHNLSSGHYFYSLKAGDYYNARPMLFIK